MNSPTADPAELAYYIRLAESWWDEDGVFWPLHRLNRIRSEYLRKAISRHFGRDPASSRPLRGIDVVDIGCGGGILSESMARLGAKVHGIDLVEKNIVVARRHARESGIAIDYELTTVEALAGRGRKYDVVLDMEVIEHVADLPLFLSASCRLLSADGIMFVATLNRTIKSWLFAIVGAEYLLGWLPRGTHDWRRFVKPSELEELLAANGLRVRETTGVKINPFNRRFSLSPRRDVNYMASAVRVDR